MTRRHLLCTRSASPESGKPTLRAALPMEALTLSVLVALIPALREEFEAEKKISRPAGITASPA